MNPATIRYKTDFPLVTIGPASERQIVVDPKISGGSDTSRHEHGFGDLVYLTHGTITAGTGVPLHPHQDLDVMPLMHRKPVPRRHPLPRRVLPRTGSLAPSSR